MKPFLFHFTAFCWGILFVLLFYIALTEYLRLQQLTYLKRNNCLGRPSIPPEYYTNKNEVMRSNKQDPCDLNYEEMVKQTVTEKLFAK
jgi:hypothetical protein